MSTSVRRDDSETETVEASPHPIETTSTQKETAGSTASHRIEETSQTRPNCDPPPSRTEETPSRLLETVSEDASVEEEVPDCQPEYRVIEFSPEEIFKKIESYNYSSERWSDSTSQISLPGQVEDVETVISDEPVRNEPTSEMYYTASSEVSLLSDTELPEKVQPDDEEREARDDRNQVIAGHVAAMRERFENMTRTNTPCPELARSLSPSLEVFRNITPSPDRLA